jgi:hypothetical protein
MATSQDRRAFWRSHAVDHQTGEIVKREPAPFVVKPTRKPRRVNALTATQGDFDRARVNRRRKLALASKRRNR